MDRQIADGLVPPDLKEKISFVLLRKHRHQTKKPIHRSLADIGKSSNVTSSKFAHLRPISNSQPLDYVLMLPYWLSIVSPFLIKSTLLCSSFSRLPPPPPLCQTVVLKLIWIVVLVQPLGSIAPQKTYALGSQAALAACVSVHPQTHTSKISFHLLAYFFLRTSSRN